MNFDLNFDLADLNFDLNFEELAETKQEEFSTSEKYKKNVKIFLDEWDIRATDIKKSTMICINNVLTDLILPEKETQLRIRTQQQINLISIIFKIIGKHKKIDELTIATYTLNQESFSLLIKLLKKKAIVRLNLFLASSYVFRDKNYYEKLKQEANYLKNQYDFHLVFAWLHFKITLAKCGDDYYQFEGSMNYSMNNMAEQVLLENNKKTYDYDYNFIKKIICNQSNKALEIVC